MLYEHREKKLKSKKEQKHTIEFFDFKKMGTTTQVLCKINNEKEPQWIYISKLSKGMQKEAKQYMVINFQ